MMKKQKHIDKKGDIMDETPAIGMLVEIYGEYKKAIIVEVQQNDVCYFAYLSDGRAGCISKRELHLIANADTDLAKAAKNVVHSVLLYQEECRKSLSRVTSL